MYGLVDLFFGVMNPWWCLWESYWMVFDLEKLDECRYTLAVIMVPLASGSVFTYSFLYKI